MIYGMADAVGRGVDRPSGRVSATYIEVGRHRRAKERLDMPSPEATEVRELTREWFMAARGGQLGGGRFSTFICVWIAFNALYAMRFDDGDGDKNQVRAFAKWERAVKQHHKLLAIPDYTVAIATLAERGVHNFRNESTIQVHDPRDLVQVLDAVYQVRCNLFHGRKSAAAMRDRALVEASRLIVYRFVAAFLDDDSVWEDV
jgi:hypothetical protein